MSKAEPSLGDGSLLEWAAVKDKKGFESVCAKMAELDVYSEEPLKTT